MKIDIVFAEASPDSPTLEFVEVEHAGRSINAGEWVKRDGYHVLQIDLEGLAARLAAK